MGTNEVDGLKYKHTSILNKSIDWFNDTIKSISFSRSKRFSRQNNNMNPIMTLSPKYESIQPSVVNTKFSQAEADNLYFKE